MSTSAAILVLGDLNRSPRMLNHSKAISDLLTDINEVSLIGFNGGCLRSDISNDNKIKTYYISDTINHIVKKLPRFLFILSALLKIIFQMISLVWILMFKIPRPKFLILQNPPGIPAIYICSIICFMRRTTFIIDWHNYGYTILDVNKRNKIIVYIAKLYEKFYGKCSKINFCVSDKMKEHLKDNMGIDAIALPDRAMPNVFKRLNMNDSHIFFNKYFKDEKETVNISNIFTDTNITNNSVTFKKNRPILMLSSTSWTPDEDFNLLLEAFIICEKKLTENKIINQKVVFIITGK